MFLFVLYPEKSYGLDTGLEESSAIDPDKNSTADEVSSLMVSTIYTYMFMVSTSLYLHVHGQY